jgi:hypothetical protein
MSTQQQIIPAVIASEETTTDIAVSSREAMGFTSFSVSDFG